ncbi:MAG: hypothetical protein ACH37Z_18320 [Anaerolineae bacterium]
MNDAIVKARKVCPGYGCTLAARCGLYIQRVTDTRPIRLWMPPSVGKDCHHFIDAPDLDHPPAGAAQAAELDGGLV